MHAIVVGFVPIAAFQGVEESQELLFRNFERLDEARIMEDSVAHLQTEKHERNQLAMGGL